MNAFRQVSTLGLVLGTMMALGQAPATAAPASEIAPRSKSGEAIRVGGVVATPRSVRAQVENLTESELRDVSFLIIHEFRWHEEQRPGRDGPGRSEKAVLTRVSPRETVTLAHDVVPPLPDRDDGVFVTRVEVLSFTQVGP